MTSGSNATIQIIYKADWDAPHNQTFYACADITYVNAVDFKTRIPCFNATEPGEDDKKAAAGKDNNSGTPASGSSGSSGLKANALAGIIVGSIVGAAGLVAIGVFLYRRREQKKRKLRLAQMEENARKTDYRDDVVKDII